MGGLENFKKLISGGDNYSVLESSWSNISQRCWNVTETGVLSQCKRNS